MNEGWKEWMNDFTQVVIRYPYFHSSGLIRLTCQSSRLTKDCERNKNFCSVPLPLWQRLSVCNIDFHQIRGAYFCNYWSEIVWSYKEIRKRGQGEMISVNCGCSAKRPTSTDRETGRRWRGGQCHKTTLTSCVFKLNIWFWKVPRQV